MTSNPLEEAEEVKKTNEQENSVAVTSSSLTNMFSRIRKHLLHSYRQQDYFRALDLLIHHRYGGLGMSESSLLHDSYLGYFEVYELPQFFEICISLVDDVQKR